MLKYAASCKQTMPDLQHKPHASSNRYNSLILDPSCLPLPSKSSHSKNPTQISSPLQPPKFLKNPRPSYQKYPNSNNFFNSTSQAATQLDQSSKEFACKVAFKFKKVQPLNISLNSQNIGVKAEPNSTRSYGYDESFNSATLKQMQNKQSTERNTLQQPTITHHLSAGKNLMQPSPIKFYNKGLIAKCLIPKEQSQKIISNNTTQHHSRSNSDHISQDSNIKEQKICFKPKVRPSKQLTPKELPTIFSQEINFKKEKLMCQTAPPGKYVEVMLGKKVKTQPCIRQKPVGLRIEDFQIGACKGEGRFGKVYAAKHRKTGWLVAIKQIKKEQIKVILDQFAQELKVNLFADHPNIVKMYGFFSDRNYFYIVMEYMQEGSLYKAIRLRKKIKEEQAALKLHEICQALKYLHTNHIFHRDIKPQNIVLTNGVSKLCDFGWAIYSRQRRNTYCGTLDYVCPEILQGQYYDNFADVWAIGVLAFEMLTGRTPFYHISRKQTMNSILNCQFTLPSELSVNAKVFIKKALKKNPSQRFTIASLLKDEFLRSYVQKE